MRLLKALSVLLLAILGRKLCTLGLGRVSLGDDARARVIVLDRDNDRICLFDREGRWIETWDGFARAPMDIWGDGERFWISDQTPAIWCVDAASGAVIGRSRGFCVYPHGIWGEPSGFFTANQQPDGVARYRRVPSYQ